MQNKANFRKVKLNVNKVLTKNYDKMDTWSIRKNEPKTNPNEPKTNPTCRGVASGEDGTNPNEPKTNPTCRGVAYGEDGTCRGVAYGEDGTNPISKAKTAGFYSYFLATELYNRGITESTL